MWTPVDGRRTRVDSSAMKERPTSGCGHARGTAAAVVSHFAACTADCWPPPRVRSPAVGADLSDAEPSRSRSRSRPAASPTRSRAWWRKNSASGSGRRSWWKTAAAPAAIWRPSGGRRGGGRTHDPRHHHGGRRQRHRVEEQGLRHRGLARRRDRGAQPGRDRHPSEQSGQGPRRVHRERPGEKLQLRQRRRRHRRRISARNISSARSPR